MMMMMIIIIGLNFSYFKQTVILHWWIGTFNRFVTAGIGVAAQAVVSRIANLELPRRNRKTQL
jgi:hypothetical protein